MSGSSGLFSCNCCCSRCCSLLLLFGCSSCRGKHRKDNDNPSLLSAEGRRTRGGKCPWVGEELQTTENNRYEQTFLYLWVRGGGGQHDVWGCCTYIMSYAKWCPLGILEKFLSVFSHFVHVLLSGLGRFRCVNGMGVTSCIKGSRLL